jgi:SAM-dependent methyltransferase
MAHRSEESLNGAVEECARILSTAVASCAVTSGLLDSLDHYQTLDDLMRRWSFHPEKARTVVTLLDLLEEQGLLEHVEGPVKAYRRKDPGDLESRLHPLERDLRRPLLRGDLLEPWLPAAHAGAIWQAQRHFLGAELQFLRQAGRWLTFDKAFLDAWQTNLTNPLYEYGRIFAVQALAGRGRRFLDLASGTGIGAQRLAEWSAQECEIICVDKSEDFLAVSRQLLFPPTTRLTHVVQDLNHGLPPLAPQSIDGVLFIGAFHYIADKASCLRQIYQVLRPGGKLAIGHCFVRSGLPDEGVNDYMFSIAKESSYILSLHSLQTLLSASGFVILDELHRGSQYTVIVERPALVQAP